jgi:hypothetical protein
MSHQMAEVAIPRNLFADILRLIRGPPPVTSTGQCVRLSCVPRKTTEMCFLLTENSACLGAPPRARSPRKASTSQARSQRHFSLVKVLLWARTLSRDKVVIWRMLVSLAHWRIANMEFTPSYLSPARNVVQSAVPIQSHKWRC